MPGSLADVSVPYHRLFRVHPRFRWWRPLVALALLLGFWVVSQVVITGVLLAIVLPTQGAEGALDFTNALANDPLDPSNPGVLALTLVSLIVLLPATWFAVKIARLGPIGQLSSVRLRIRWGWMGRLLLPLLVLAVLTVGVQAVGIPGLIDGYFRWQDGRFVADPGVGVATVDTRGIVIAIVMVVVLVPFQAAAEEYIFRGFTIQTVGSWVRSPIPGLFVSTAVFAAAHVPNGYNVWAILDVGSFGFIAALLVWRTGGLEAGILAHALNNVGIFVLQAPGWTKIDPSSGEETPVQLAYTVITLGIYALLVELMAKRGLDRRRPGTEFPRFRGLVPAWAARAVDGWSGTPSLSGSASGVPVAGSDGLEALHTPATQPPSVGGRP